MTMVFRFPSRPFSVLAAPGLLVSYKVATPGVIRRHSILPKVKNLPFASFCIVVLGILRNIHYPYSRRIHSFFKLEPSVHLLW